MTEDESERQDGIEAGSADRSEERRLRDLRHEPPDGLGTTDVFQRGSRAAGEGEDEA